MFSLGVFVSGTGIALLVKADIGSSAIPSLSYVCTQICPSLTLGTYTFLLNLTFFVLQFVVQRGGFTLGKLLQLVPTALMGLTADINMVLLEGFTMNSYGERLFTLIVGCLLFAVSIDLMVSSRLLLMPMDEFITILARKKGWVWGNIKTTVDLLLILIALVLSLVFLGRLEGIREGTIIAAIGVGQFCRLVKRPVEWVVWGREVPEA